MKFEPSLQFNGDCFEALSFYSSVFNGSIEMLLTWGDSPMSAHVPSGYENRIMHASMRVGDNLIMGSDSLSGATTAGSAVSISISIPSVEESERVFVALASGGLVFMPFQPTFWAKGFGQLTDRFGIPWMVNCEDRSKDDGLPHA